MFRLRKLFSRSSRSGKSFHPDQPPPEPYPAPNPYSGMSSTDKKHPIDTYPAPPQEQPSYSHEPPPPFDLLPPTYDDDNLPPPAFHALQLSSPTSNAPSDLAESAWDFTDVNPLAPPSHFTPASLFAIRSGNIGLAPPPPRFSGLITSRLPGRISIASARACPDTCLFSALPLYAAGYHHPLNTATAKSIYFELLVEHMPADSAITLGFAAVPYPGFRLPGWNRGSLGVHGDDGRRYVNDSFGGRDFVSPFKDGERVGIGMTWSTNQGVEVWFTREGKRVDGWRLDEPRDGEEENDPMAGLDGWCDVYAAVGIWGGDVRAEVRFLPEGEGKN